LNILFFSTESPFPLDHGHHLRTYHVLKALAQDHCIHFIAFTKNQEYIKYKQELEELCESVNFFPLRFQGWRQIILALQNLFSPLPLSARKYYDPQVAAHIKRLIVEVNIDLVHLDLLHLAHYRKDLGSLPSILVNHNVESLRVLRWSKVEQNPLLKYFLRYQYFKLKNFEKRVCRDFDRCTVVSDYDKNVLSELCDGGSFVTIPNGVDAKYFRVSNQKILPNTLVWTGSMSGPYNRDAVSYFLKEIWPLIQSRLPDAKVTFVGSSPSKILKKLSLQAANIEYTGYVEDIRPFVDRAAVFIAPLRCGSGTKVKVLNAMSQAKAVLTTSIGAEGIDARLGEEIMIADEPADFADQAIYLLQNPHEAKKIGQRARKVIEEKYDWQVINTQIRKVYQEFETQSIQENYAASENI